MTEAEKKTVGVAIASMVLGILGFLCLGPLASIPAVICGHIAMSAIKKDREGLAGDGMAIAGLIMGYIQIALMVVMIPLLVAIAIPAFVRARGMAENAVCYSNLAQVETAKSMVVVANEYEDGATISNEQLSEYLNADLEDGLHSLICPDEGEYSINPVGEDVTCSVHGTLAESMPFTMDLDVE